MSQSYHSGVQKQTVILNNGVRLVHIYRPSMPITLRVYFYSGSRFDPHGKEGLAHFTEHMLVAGTHKYPTKDLLAGSIEYIGGDFSAFTESEGFGIQIEVGDILDLPDGIDTVSEMLSAPLFNAAIIETERGAILEELKASLSSPRSTLGNLYSSLIFQESPIGRSTLGSEETINSISRDDLIHFYQKHIVSGRMVLICSGDVSIQQLSEILNKHLRVNIGGQMPAPARVPYVRRIAQAAKYFPGSAQTFVNFGYRMSLETIFDGVIMGLIARLLGGGRTSRLSKILRYERGLVYSVGASSYSMSGASVFTIGTSTSPNNLQDLLDLITEELIKISRWGFSKDELDFIQTRILRSSKRYVQTSSAMVNYYSTLELLHSEENYSLDKFMSQVASVTLDMLNDSFNRFISLDMWYLAMCGDIHEDAVVVNI